MRRRATVCRGWELPGDQWLYKYVVFGESECLAERCGVTMYRGRTGLVVIWEWLINGRDVSRPYGSGEAYKFLPHLISIFFPPLGWVLLDIDPG